jgi:hypothetical protein
MKGLALAGLLIALAGEAGANETFKDWWTTCDNTRDCAAFGFSEQSADVTGYLKVTRDGVREARPRVKIVMYSDDGGPWRLAVDGRFIANVEGRGEDGGAAFAELTPAQSADLVAAAVRGNWLEVTADGRPVGRISLAGSAAALRWVDGQQKRAGTTTAIVARGRRGAVPPPPAPPVVRAAPAASQAKLPSEPPASVLARTKDCEDQMGDLDVAPVVGRLSPDLTLWAPLCSHGAYNLIYRLLIVDAAGARPAPLSYPGRTEEEFELMNVEYDGATQTLSNFDKGRGLGDCGAQTDWVWDGERFIAKGQLLMGECRGVPLDDWPVSYRTRPAD